MVVTALVGALRGNGEKHQLFGLPAVPPVGVRCVRTSKGDWVSFDGPEAEPRGKQTVAVRCKARQASSDVVDR